VDPVNGDDDNPGTNWENPMKGVEAAEDKCVGDRHDTVLLLAGDTADTPSAKIAWDKDYTHLIGLGPNLRGLGCRSRIVGTAALDLTSVIEFSGNGCIVRNVQIFNGADADADSGAAIVSGGRNEFDDVFFAGMGHATPAARAGSYSLSLTGSENNFERVTIGLNTILRAQSNAELIISGAACYRNKFIMPEFLSWSVTAGKVLVKFAAGAKPWVTQFEDALFDNLDMTAGGADGASIDNAISDASGAKHHCLLRGKVMIAGCTGVADTLTNIFSAEPVPATGFGLAVNPAA
jgi:hypothetical protein